MASPGRWPHPTQPVPPGLWQDAKTRQPYPSGAWPPYSLTVDEVQGTPRPCTAGTKGTPRRDDEQQHASTHELGAPDVQSIAQLGRQAAAALAEEDGVSQDTRGELANSAFNFSPGTGTGLLFSPAPPRSLLGMAPMTPSLEATAGRMSTPLRAPPRLNRDSLPRMVQLTAPLEVLLRESRVENILVNDGDDIPFCWKLPLPCHSAPTSPKQEGDPMPTTILEVDNAPFGVHLRPTLSPDVHGLPQADKDVSPERVIDGIVTSRINTFERILGTMELADVGTQEVPELHIPGPTLETGPEDATQETAPAVDGPAQLMASLVPFGSDGIGFLPGINLEDCGSCGHYSDEIGTTELTPVGLDDGGSLEPAFGGLTQTSEGPVEEAASSSQPAPGHARWSLTQRLMSAVGIGKTRPREQQSAKRTAPNEPSPGTEEVESPGAVAEEPMQGAFDALSSERLFQDRNGEASFSTPLAGAEGDEQPFSALGSEPIKSVPHLAAEPSPRLHDEALPRHPFQSRSFHSSLQQSLASMEDGVTAASKAIESHKVFLVNSYIDDAIDEELTHDEAAAGLLETQVLSSGPLNDTLEPLEYADIDRLEDEREGSRVSVPQADESDILECSADFQGEQDDADGVVAANYIRQIVEAGGDTALIMQIVDEAEGYLRCDSEFEERQFSEDFVRIYTAAVDSYGDLSQDPPPFELRDLCVKLMRKLCHYKQSDMVFGEMARDFHNFLREYPVGMTEARLFEVRAYLESKHGNDYAALDILRDGLQRADEVGSSLLKAKIAKLERRLRERRQGSQGSSLRGARTPPRSSLPRSTPPRSSPPATPLAPSPGPARGEAGEWQVKLETLEEKVCTLQGEVQRLSVQQRPSMMVDRSRDSGVATAPHLLDRRIVPDPDMSARRRSSPGFLWSAEAVHGGTAPEPDEDDVLLGDLPDLEVDPDLAAAVTATAQIGDVTDVPQEEEEEFMQSSGLWFSPASAPCVDDADGQQEQVASHAPLAAARAMMDRVWWHRESFPSAAPRATGDQADASGTASAMTSFWTTLGRRSR